MRTLRDCVKEVLGVFHRNLDFTPEQNRALASLEVAANREIKKEFYSQIYDLLIFHAKAPLSYKGLFIADHANAECDEFRFGGIFGHGGKYWRTSNKISLYREHETPELTQIQNFLNGQFDKIRKQFDSQFVDWQ